MSEYIYKRSINDDLLDQFTYEKYQRILDYCNNLERRYTDSNPNIVDSLDQIEKQLAKLVDVRHIKELKPGESVYRELALVKVRTEEGRRSGVIEAATIYHGKIVDSDKESLTVEIVGNQTKIEAFLSLISDYEILELARTGLAGLERGIDNVVFLD